MSLIQSARLNGHDPYAYLKDVLDIFYVSAAWKQGPRANIISRIEISTTTVIDGWRLTLFNDGGTLDYCGDCRTPDGRVGTIEDWQRYGTDPVEQLFA
jgi:hypothetical protein